jgi:hypothetical protein
MTTGIKGLFIISEKSISDLKIKLQVKDRQVFLLMSKALKRRIN